MPLITQYFSHYLTDSQFYLKAHWYEYYITHLLYFFSSIKIWIHIKSLLKPVPCSFRDHFVSKLETLWNSKLNFPIFCVSLFFFFNKLWMIFYLSRKIYSLVVYNIVLNCIYTQLRKKSCYFLNWYFIMSQISSHGYHIIRHLVQF